MNIKETGSNYIIKYEDMSGIQSIRIIANTEYEAERKFNNESSHSRLGKGKLISIKKD